MTVSLLSRTLHKWLALFVGLQLLVWTVSGLYMVVVDLDFIHGDTLVRNLRTPLTEASSVIPVAQLLQRYPEVTQISLRSLPESGEPVYEVATLGRRVLVHARNGRQLSPLSAGMIRQLARSYYAGSGELVSVVLLEHEVPMEARGRVPPLWRADFNDWLQTSLYLHPSTGALVTRRHRLWRWFDFLWMLHIMDYAEREDMNSGLLRAATALGVITTASGVWLLYFSFRRNPRN
jgi:uncharacterized iron-regulated membrane protein